MEPRPLIFLIGYRGSGKTTVSWTLARRLGWGFADTDEYIERLSWKTIKEIFAAEGEKGFRNRESTVLADLSTLEEHIISTGGGVVLRKSNRELLRRGFVVWLTATPEVLWERIQADAKTAANRPNLTAAGGVEEVRQLLALREPLYREVTDFAIDVSSLSPDDAADAILAAWKSGGSTPRSSSGPSGSSSSA